MSYLTNSGINKFQEWPNLEVSDGIFHSDLENFVKTINWPFSIIVITSFLGKITYGTGKAILGNGHI